VFGYDWGLRRSGLTIVNMFFSSSLQLSFGLTDVWSTTIMARNLVDHIVIIEVIIGVFMNLNELPKIIEYSVSCYILWTVQCGSYWFRQLIDEGKTTIFLASEKFKSQVLSELHFLLLYMSVFNLLLIF